MNHPKPENIISICDMSIDQVDSGLPRITFDASATGGHGPVTWCLAPDAVTAIVDALVGVAQPAPGECRVVVKFATDDLGRAMLAMPSLRSEQTKTYAAEAPAAGGDARRHGAWRDNE